MLKYSSVSQYLEMAIKIEAQIQTWRGEEKRQLKSQKSICESQKSELDDSLFKVELRN